MSNTKTCFKILIMCNFLFIKCETFDNDNLIGLTKSGNFFDVVRGVVNLFSASCGAISKFSNNNDRIDTNRINMLYFHSNNFHKYNMLSMMRVLPNMPVFNRNAKTIVFIHGFNCEPDEPLTHRMAEGYLTREPVNFFSYDVRELVRNDYIASVRRTPYLAKMLSIFLRNLIDMGVRSDRIHLIGFSLGAQIAGFAARRLRTMNETVYRITALDPARPCFLAETEGSLNENDAIYVDVIHTSLISYSDRRMGHADFYVNNVLGIQPGCEALDIPCSHIRSLQIYIESLYGGEGLVAKKCGEYTLSGRCDKSVVSFVGYSSNPRTRGVYLLKTRGRYPYAMGFTGFERR